MEVKDSSLDKSSEAAHVQDSVEIFIDENNHKTDGYEEDDKQYRINYENEPSFNGQKCIADNLISQTRKTEDGYIVEAACNGRYTRSRNRDWFLTCRSMTEKAGHVSVR